ncbi:MAG: metalloregulator ArsR/SmtB family transcription factor [Pseudomonadota bacterium]|nr:metalloregulator ArsR/SmtB family transcription factor [Pseudomonadota bacterium]
MTHALPSPAAAQIAPEQMRAGAEAALVLLKALANHDRLMLLCQLSQGESTVGALEAALQIRQPTLSQQLAVLRNEGLVSTRREGKHIHYAIASAEALRLLQTLHEVFCPK